METIKILLIDDDEINNFISSKLLKKAIPDCEVRSELNGLSGIGMFNEWNPDIVLLDTNMPIMNGWEFLDKVVVGHDCKIFIVASSVFSNDINRARQYSSIKDFISKPLSIDKIKDIILQ